MDIIKKINFEDFLSILEENYENYLDEVTYLSEAKKIEGRINNFIHNLIEFRNMKKRLKLNLKKSIKVEECKTKSNLIFKTDTLNPIIEHNNINIKFT